MAPAEPSVNATVIGAAPLVGAALNAATGTMEDDPPKLLFGQPQAMTGSMPMGPFHWLEKISVSPTPMLVVTVVCSSAQMKVFALPSANCHVQKCSPGLPVV